MVPRGRLPPLARAWLPRSRSRSQLWAHYTTRGPEYRGPTSNESPNAHREFYRSFGIPTVKVFLGALLTYQIIYLAWLNLEEVDIKHQKEEEMQGLIGALKIHSTKEDENMGR